MKFFKLKRLWWLLCAPAAALLLGAAILFPAFAEWYATTVYPALSRAGNFLSGLFPFSLAEWLVILVVIAVPAYLVFAVVSMIRKKEGRAARAVKLTVNPFCVAAAVFLLFAVTCGVNYHRYTFSQTCGLEVRESSIGELTALCEKLANDVNRLRPQMPEDEAGVTKLPADFALSGQEARTAVESLKEDYPLLTSGYGTPKAVGASRVMSYLDTTGIFIPFTFEANVNVDAPDYGIPATMCHELSHLRGYMREDEANFIGVLACEKSTDPVFQYSGAMLSYKYSINALYGEDAEAANKIASTLCEGAWRDLNDDNAYWKQFESPVREFATAVNNGYLQANLQKDGVKSYGRMVDLLLAEARQTDLDD